MWLTESQVQLIMEALVPPALQSALDKHGVSHLVDRHDAMYLASKNTQYPDTEGQHEWRITALTKGTPEGVHGGIHDVTPNYHFSYKDPEVLAQYMKKIHTVPEHWGHMQVHGMLQSDAEEGRRGGQGERLYATTPEREAEHKAEDYKMIKDWEDNFESNMKPYKTESTVYEAVVTDIVNNLLEDKDTSMVMVDGFYVTRLLPHMPIHKRNKIATVMAGCVGNTPTP